VLRCRPALQTLQKVVLIQDQGFRDDQELCVGVGPDIYEVADHPAGEAAVEARFARASQGELQLVLWVPQKTMTLVTGPMEGDDDLIVACRPQCSPWHSQ
jgi:hypothetical protein